MPHESVVGGTCGHPFPVYPNLVDTLLAAHQTGPLERDATVGHVLGTCAGYAYSDTETVSTIMTRLGLERHACVRIAQTVDAMFIFSTAYLVQSHCGRVVILCYRGTEPATLGNWLGDAEVGPASSALRLANGEKVRVHAGFHRNVRATWWDVINELTMALEGKSVADHGASVEHPMEALYITGHSLGGAMALLFTLTVWGHSTHQSITDRVRAVYTFGQPMAVAQPLPRGMEDVGGRLLRHIIVQDPVPALPPARWGPFVHLGLEYRFVEGRWQQAESPVAPLASLREIPRSLLATFAGEKRRGSQRYVFAEHGPQHYIAALRPDGMVTEFGV